jgi:hypothetical protein
MFESYAKSGRTEIATGAIPFTHGYGLALGHLTVYRGDSLIVIPRFDMQLMLKIIPQYRIERLWLVPPILAAFAANPFLLNLYDISSVQSIVTGAAALDRTLAGKLHDLQPHWKFIHAYGTSLPTQSIHPRPNIILTEQNNRPHRNRRNRHVHIRARRLARLLGLSNSTVPNPAREGRRQRRRRAQRARRSTFQLTECLRGVSRR